MTQPAHEQGFVALMAVLIVGVVSLAIATTLLLAGTDTQRATLIEQQSFQARNLANACAEEGLQQLHDNLALLGTSSLTLGQGTCGLTIASTGASTRSIATVGTVNTVVRKVMVYVTIGSSSISVTSWQEVP